MIYIWIFVDIVVGVFLFLETSGTSRNADMQNSRNIIPIQDPLMAAGRAGFTPHRILRGRRLRRPAGNFPNTRYP